MTNAMWRLLIAVGAVSCAVQDQGDALAILSFAFAVLITQVGLQCVFWALGLNERYHT